MDEERSMLQRVAHRYLVSLPDGKRFPQPLLIALHGYAGDMTSMMRAAKKVARGEIVIASLQGPHEFWPLAASASDRVGFGWLTNYQSAESRKRHHRLVQHVVRELADGGLIDPARVFLMGFSQSCALNYRYAFTHPGKLRGVVGICGGIPGDFDHSKYRRIRAGVLHVAATRDPYYPLERARQFEGALRRRAADVTYKEYAYNHAIPPRSIRFVREWILKRLI